MPISSNTSLSPVLLLSSGFLGPNREGNQSLKNTLIGFLEAGYMVYHFSFVSEKDPAFDFSDLQETKRYHHFGVLLLVLSTLRVLNKVFRNKKNSVVLETGFSGEVDIGESEITWKQNVVVLLGTVFEFFRMLIAALVLRPRLFYGYEVSGMFAAFALSRLFKKKCITRFQGTYVTKKNMRLWVMRFHVAGLRLQSEGVVITNDGTRGDKVAQALGIPKERLFFRPNGIDDRLWDENGTRKPDPELRNRLNGSSSRYVAGLFTRFYPYKRVDRCIMLVERFLHENVSLHLVICGSGPLEQELKTLARERGVENNLTWIGSVPYAEMAAYYMACDVVLHLNDYANINNQVLEAVHLGVPLLAIDDGYNSTMFGDCPYALFIPRDQVESIGWKEIERIIDQRGVSYTAPHIRSWKERMKEEVEWIEKL